ncbi:MAG TPA: c-type cytochrome [Rhizomicrobium sp.]|nr:c-type cytochrome [Rhizomicrobium sp.]
MKRVLVSLVFGSACIIPVMAQDTALYTADQAAQGAALYASQCAACHGAQLEGIAGPALTGRAFHQMAAAQNLTAKSLLDVISTTMPMTAPGKLTADQYAALAAFILQRSGYPAGSKPLSKDNPDLAGLNLGADSTMAAGSPGGPQAGAARLASQGVYTAQQMADGKDAYNNNCIQCHGGELEGVEDAPPLSGKPFISKWGGLPVGAVHAYIDKNMPPGNGGALGPNREAAVVAYILSKNGFPAGPTALPADPAGLNGIMLK